MSDYVGPPRTVLFGGHRWRAEPRGEYGAADIGDGTQSPFTQDAERRCVVAFINLQTGEERLGFARRRFKRLSDEELLEVLKHARPQSPEVEGPPDE